MVGQSLTTCLRFRNYTGVSTGIDCYVASFVTKLENVL